MRIHKVREAVGMAVGEASMCWGQTPRGIFQDDKARAIVDRLMDLIAAERGVLRDALARLTEAAADWADDTEEGGHHSEWQELSRCVEECQRLLSSCRPRKKTK